MAKGKHAPAPGAVKKDKVIHPKSRIAGRMQSFQLRRSKVNSQVKSGGARLQLLGDKLLWFHDNLNLFLAEGVEMTKTVMLELATGYLARFDDELEQINLKNSIGGSKNNKRTQHRSRQDTIEFTQKTEKDELEGCGLEMPDLLNSDNLKYFKDWNGELRFVQNIKLRRFSRKDLEKVDEEPTATEKEGMDTD